MKVRVRILFVFVLATAVDLAPSTQGLAQTDPLASWNDGPTKQAIVEFVRTTTAQSSPQFVPLAERIAGGAIFSAGDLLSGHTLKHLAAAVACFAILRCLETRRLLA